LYVLIMMYILPWWLKRGGGDGAHKAIWDKENNTWFSGISWKIDEVIKGSYNPLKMLWGISGPI